MQTNHRFVYVNTACVRMLAADSPADVVGQRVLDRFHRDDHASVAARIRRLNEERLPVENRVERMVTQDGVEVPVELSAVPFVFEGANGALVFVRDVTQRQRNERSLRESEGMLRMAGQVAQLGGWSVTLPPERVVWSDEAAAIHEMPAGTSPTVEEALRFYAPEYRDRMTNVFGACVSDGVPFDEEAQILTASDRRVWVRAIGQSERDETGRIVRVKGAFQDITERRSLEERLLQSQKIESLGRLAGGVAHDYNNMLTVIIGKAELARLRLDPDHPVQRDIDEILAAGRRSAEITRQLLGFARKQTIAPRRLDLNLTLKRMLSILGLLIGEDIDLAWRPGVGLGHVLLDPVQIDQILTNLCINARDAIGGVGRITIETCNITIDEAYCRTRPGFVAGDFVMLAVSDDGCGMDAVTLSKAFEPFYTTKGVGEGTGLGLATVYGIVKQNGGFINVYSERGIGTTLKIYLPRLPPDDDGRERDTVTAEAIGPHGGETLLVVEDDPV